MSSPLKFSIPCIGAHRGELRKHVNERVAEKLFK